ncbi:exonuclease [Halobacteria archaeon AArc-dxtr1]|nr:exonuclease [Halobacteria archaeon AArc-dxtr1]
MSADGRLAPAPIADALESAGFVRLLARPDGDAIAAGGLLATALADGGVPFQVSVGRPTERSFGNGEPDRENGQSTGSEDDVVLRIGRSNVDSPALDPTAGPVSLAAWELARELGGAPDPVLALAGSVAAGVDPGAAEVEALLEAAHEAGTIERRPGVAVPTADPIDGLAHSTRIRAPWSGDIEATREAFSDAVADDPESDETHRAVASLAAIDAVATDGATDRAARSVSTAVRPYATLSAPFETVGGYADVLDAVARVEPGTGVALAMGHQAAEPALTAWRAHGRRVHAALDGARTGRYDGLFVVDVDDGSVESVARLAADYRSPEPVTLVVGDGEAAFAVRDGSSVGPIFAGVTDELREGDVECECDPGSRGGHVRYDRDGDKQTLIDATRGAL